MKNKVAQTLRETRDYLAWNRALSSPETKEVTLREVLTDMCSTSLDENITSRILLEAQGPERDAFLPHMLLLNHGPLNRDETVFVAKVIAGGIPTENVEQREARAQLISIFSDYLEMRDALWGSGSQKVLSSGSGLSISMERYREISMKHKIRSDQAMERFMAAWGKTYSPSTSEIFPSYSIIRVPYNGITPLQHLDNKRREYEREMMRNLAKLLRDAWFPQKSTEDDPQDKSTKNITFEVIREKSAQEKREQALPTLEGAYSGLELVLLSGLGEKILCDEKLQSALGEQLSHLTWGNLLEFAALAKEYNADWALASMEWE